MYEDEHASKIPLLVEERMKILRLVPNDDFISIQFDDNTMIIVKIRDNVHSSMENELIKCLKIDVDLFFV